MRGSRLLLAAAILVLSTGAFLFVNTTIIPHETLTSLSRYSVSGEVSGQYFEYSGGTLTADNTPQFVVGTTGVADLIVLKTPVQNFSQWVCHRMQPSWGCAGFGGGDINMTILYSYLQAHQSEILSSQTIVDQNVTLDHHTVSTDFTVVLAPMQTSIHKYFFQVTRTNETVAYPLLGWTDSPRSTWTLANISTGVVLGGAILLAGSILIRNQALLTSNQTTGHYSRKCPACGRENLSFAKVCSHCGSTMINSAL